MPAQERGPVGPSRKTINPELSVQRARFVRIDARRAPFRQTRFVERNIPAKPQDQLKPIDPAYFTEKLGQLRRNPRYTPEQVDIFVGRTLVRQQRQVERARKREKQAHKDSEIDPLTNLYNRNGIQRRFEGVLSHADRTGEPVSLFIGDLDHFKGINDRYGHNAGDAVLRHTATHLRNSNRADVPLGRHGGEEFIGFLPNTDAKQAVNAMNRQRIELPEAVDKALVHDGKHKIDRDVTMSIGVATYDRRAYEERFGTRPEQLRKILIRELAKKKMTLSDMGRMRERDRVLILKTAERTRQRNVLDYLTEQADQAMYQAKQAGRDRVFVAETPSVYDRMS